MPESGRADTFAILYPHLYGIDFRRDVPSLDVPVYVLDGAAELKGRRDLAIEWLDGLQGAHQQANAVQQLMNETIVPATYGK